MKWLFGFLATTLLTCPCEAGWQSRDSNYNVVIVSGGGGAYTGPGDVATAQGISQALVWWGLQAYSAAKAGTKAANICNAGDANCADVNSLANGNFDVATAQGAPLNCGGAGGTCTIKTLYDQTGALSCFSTPCDVTQATIASRPTLVFNCSSTNPCMACGGAALLQGSGGFPSTNQPFTYSLIVKRTGGSGSFTTAMEISGGGNDLLQFANSANTMRMFGGASLSATVSDNSFHGIQAVWNSTSSDLNVDGTSNTGNAGTGSIVTFWQLCSDGANAMTGNLEEAGVWGIAFSGTNSSAINTNQHSRFGF
jgi:hypothetical protein